MGSLDEDISIGFKWFNYNKQEIHNTNYDKMRIGMPKPYSSHLLHRIIIVLCIGAAWVTKGHTGLLLQMGLSLRIKSCAWHFYSWILNKLNYKWLKDPLHFAIRRKYILILLIIIIWLRSRGGNTRWFIYVQEFRVLMFLWSFSLLAWHWHDYTRIKKNRSTANTEYY